MASERGLAVVEREELGEEHQWHDGAELLREFAEQDVVVCGHGGLEQALCTPRKWRKGAAFVLDEKLRITGEA